MLKKPIRRKKVAPELTSLYDRINRAVIRGDSTNALRKEMYEKFPDADEQFKKAGLK
jgi:hypothetical protein